MKVDLSKRGKRVNQNDSYGFTITKPQEIINLQSSMNNVIEDNKIQFPFSVLNSFTLFELFIFSSILKLII